MTDLTINPMRWPVPAGSASETIGSKDRAERFDQALARAAQIEGQAPAETGAGLSPAEAERLRLQMLLSLLTLLSPDPLDAEDGSDPSGRGADDWLMSLARAWPATDGLKTGLSTGPGLLPPGWPLHIPALSGRITDPDMSASRPDGQKFDGLIEKAADAFGLDPHLVKAVIKAESGFEPEAVSPAGARGLMQLMPDTARDLGVGDAFDPVQNVYGGCRYLRQMLDRYGGDLDQALAAYNWGPGRMDRAPASLPDETRVYIQRVRQFRHQFARSGQA
jgi:hypothetical protein